MARMKVDGSRKFSLKAPILCGYEQASVQITALERFCRDHESGHGQEHRTRQLQRDRHRPHRAAGQRTASLARGRGADLGHAQGPARHRPGRYGLVRLPPVGTYNRQAKVWPADGRGLGNGAPRPPHQGATARRAEAATDDHRVRLRLRRQLGASARRDQCPRLQSRRFLPPLYRRRGECAARGLRRHSGVLRAARRRRRSRHPEHAEAEEWLAEYDPNVIDELRIKYALRRIANRREAAKARLSKKNRPGSSD